MDNQCKAGDKITTLTQPVDKSNLSYLSGSGFLPVLCLQCHFNESYNNFNVLNQF